MTLLIIVLFVVIVKGELFEFIDGCILRDNSNQQETTKYLDSDGEYNFYETYNSLSFDFTRQKLPINAGFFIVGASLIDGFGNRKDPLSLTFSSLQSKTIVHITFSKNQFSNYNGWSYLSNDYYYDYYGTFLEIRYLLCTSLEELKTFGFYLTVGCPLSSVDEYKLTAKLLKNPALSNEIMFNNPY